MTSTVDTEHPSPKPDEDNVVPPTMEPYTPVEIPYSEAFENSIMNTVLNPHGAFHPPPYPSGNAIPPDPDISASDLPLPLHDYRRIYPSPVPGILLPHPLYTLHGAKGPSEEQLIAQAEELCKKHNIRTKAQFDHWVDAEIASQMRELKERMRARQRAIKENDRVMLEVRRLDMERDMERRVAERWRSRRKTSGGSGKSAVTANADLAGAGNSADAEEKEDGEMDESSDSDIGAVMG
jgi:hypothetical protein